MIRPIRCDYLELSSLDPWDDDPNPRFDYESSLRWVQRFDEDSDWPDAEKRRQGHSGKFSRPNVPVGQPCPEAGWWYTPVAKDSRRYFNQSDTMPSIEGSTYGDTYWLWDANQDSPSL